MDASECVAAYFPAFVCAHSGVCVWTYAAATHRQWAQSAQTERAGNTGLLDSLPPHLVCRAHIH